MNGEREAINPSQMSEEEHIMHEAGERAEKNDAEWMESTARAEDFARKIETIDARITEMERDGNTDQSDVESLRNIKNDYTTQGTVHLANAALIERSSVLNERDEGYSVAREAIAWMENVNEGWELAGSTPAEHVLHTVEHDNNIVDEGKLRALEASAFTRIEKAWREGIPDHLKPRFVEELRRYVRLSDDTRLKSRADEIVRRITAES